MGQGNEKRRHARFSYSSDDGSSLPLSVEVPELMRMPPIGLEDFSLGGFKVVVLQRPEEGEAVTLAVNIGDITMNNISARVVRVLENFGEPPTWTIGLSLDMPERKQRIFTSLLEDFVGESD